MTAASSINLHRLGRDLPWNRLRNPQRLGKAMRFFPVDGSLACPHWKARRIRRPLATDTRVVWQPQREPALDTWPAGEEATTRRPTLAAALSPKAALASVFCGHHPPIFVGTARCQATLFSPEKIHNLRLVQVACPRRKEWPASNPSNCRSSKITTRRMTFIQAIGYLSSGRTSHARLTSSPWSAETCSRSWASGMTVGRQVS